MTKPVARRPIEECECSCPMGMGAEEGLGQDMFNTYNRFVVAPVSATFSTTIVFGVFFNSYSHDLETP